MLSEEVIIKYIGGPTALLEIAGLRLLTDPTFDGKGTDYTTPVYTLHKLADPLIKSEAIGKIDIVLLSHDHHFDNFDNEGRRMTQKAGKVITTTAGAERIDGNTTGLENWQSIEIPAKDNRVITITGTPCRHGPVGSDRGPVTGFVLNFKNENKGAMYITGDTVWYEGVEEVAKRFNIGLMLLFMGAARVKNVGPHHLTMTVEEGIKAAKLFKDAIIVPLHFEGWGHFTESRAEIEEKFREEGLQHRLQWAH